MVYTEFVQMKVDQKTIEDAGLDRRFISENLYQNVTWENSSAGKILLNDNKGCYTEVPLAWVVPYYD